MFHKKTDRISVAAILLLAALIISSCKVNGKDDPEPGQPEIELTASITPADGSADIDIDSNIVITFSEAVSTTGWSVAVESDTYTNASAEISWNSGNTVLTITPAASFPYDTEINVGLYGFTAVSNSGALSGQSAFAFTTVAENLPLTASISPADGSADIDVDSDIVITFSEAVGTAGWSVTVESDTYTNASPEISFSSGNTMLTINPATSLPYDTEINVGLSGFTAASDSEALSGQTDFSFTTEILIIPVTASILPADDSTDVAVYSDIVFTFSEAVSTTGWSVTVESDTYTSASPQIAWTSGNTVLTINPFDSLPYDSEINITLTGFTAADDNAALSGQTAFSFQTAAMSGSAYTIGWGNVQWPESITATPGTIVTVYGRAYVPGVTDITFGGPDPDPLVTAQFGYGPSGTDPLSAPAEWIWIDAEINMGAGDGNNDEYMADISVPVTGTYYYCYRYSGDGGVTWTYCDLENTPNFPLLDEFPVMVSN